MTSTVGRSQSDQVASLRRNVLAFIAGNADLDAGIGAYRYSQTSSKPTLYSSTYAAMARGLLGELDSLTDSERTEWLAYLNSHQDEDGLYSDPAIAGQGWYADDPLWCGRTHLTCHVIIALDCLGGAAERPMGFLDPWRDVDFVRRWLQERDWAGLDYGGNEIKNVGTLLQYSRDFHGDVAAGRAVAVMLEWLASHHVQPETGTWGIHDISDPIVRSQAVMAAFHWWVLFDYDDVPIPYVERAIDTVLATQNPSGGFGWGVHNPDEPFMSSACEDIDSISPLCWMMQMTGHRHADIEAALHKAAERVLTNQTLDGGFVFMRNRPFEYGHPELSGQKDAGSMFPTWFRLLSLALIGKVLPNHPLHEIPWHFVGCPSHQYWPELPRPGKP